LNIEGLPLLGAEDHRRDAGRLRWDHEFESGLLQQRVRNELPLPGSDAHAEVRPPQLLQPFLKLRGRFRHCRAGGGITTGLTPASDRLEDLNGDRSPQTINVILLTVPVGASGIRPTTSLDVQQYIHQQGWSDEEASAIYGTMKTLSYFKRQSHRGLHRIRRNAQLILDGIGVNPDLGLVRK
jgi:hypothetical protein